ncbi:MAG: peptide-methionine (S)-S-oxide reductase MsrA [Rhodospirillales bacterium]|nr:peptide-methionine (S)-S-oxide reductase MsrA [Rhodospirillales bacterium]
MNKLFGFLPAAALACALSEAKAAPLPDPVFDAPLEVGEKAAPQSIVLAGGCFWGVQAVFQHVRGVSEVLSGYAGGSQATARYEKVSQGGTGHAEAVLVIYDPSKVSLGKLLKVFFSVAHDPTQKDRQGPDVGTQYRSAVFPSDDSQAAIAKAYIEQLDAAGVFPKPITTNIEPLRKFYPAEPYHQNYVRKNPGNGYVAAHDLPKLASLGKVFPELFVISQ